MTLGYSLTGPDSAPVLVLGGSLGTTRTMWQPQVEALAGEYRLLAFDHRGHGASPAPPGPYRIDDLGTDLLALLDQLGLDRVHYAGLSLGGMLGIWLASHAPQRVDRLALLCTAAHLPPAQGWRDRAATVRAHGMAAIADAVLARWFTPGYPEVAGHPELLVHLADEFLACPPEGYAGCCEAIAALDLCERLPGIAAPTLVISGADDRAIPPVHGELIARGVPGARFEVLTGAAHLASVERPETVNSLLRRHFSAA